MTEHMIPTMESNKELRKLMKEISEFLCKIIKDSNFVRYYWEASQKAEKLIELLLGKNSNLPIDVEKMAEKMGIKIEEEDLSIFASKSSVNKKIGQIIIREDFFSETTFSTIYVDRSASPLVKRYAIAHELVHFIMHFDKKNYYEDYCIMPMCPTGIEEIVADIFACFILIPVRSFFKEFYAYVQQRTIEENVPIATEYWIKYLAERSVLPEYYVAYTYQQLRYVAYWIYQAWRNDDKNLDGSDKMTEDERSEIKEATQEYFSLEMMNDLFQ